MVHIFREERNKILYTLLLDGVLCLKKEFHGEHRDTGVDNLKVWMLVRSLQSKGYVEVLFSWRSYYCTITNNGIAYIKEKLGIEESFQPVTRVVRQEFVDMEKNQAEQLERKNKVEGGDKGRFAGVRGARRAEKGNSRAPEAISEPS